MLTQSAQTDDVDWSRKLAKEHNFKMESDEVLVHTDKKSSIQRYVERTNQLFGVSSSWKLVELDQGSCEKCRKSMRSLHSAYNRHAVVRIFHENGCNKTVRLAKEYLLSSCVCDADKSEVRGSYSEEAYSVIRQHHDDLERRSRAVLTLHADGRTVSIWGLDANVRMARALISDLLVPLGARSHALLVAVKSAGANDRFSNTLSPGAESHDSCYDSDGSHSLSRHSSHDDVSRTVSDTLAAERVETGTIAAKPRVRSSESSPPSLATQQSGKNIFASHRVTKNSSPTPDQSDALTDSTESLSEDPEYLKRLAYVTKLGFSEAQLRVVLEKRGAGISQNELVDELVQLGSQGKSTDEDSNSGSPEPDVDVHTEQSALGDSAAGEPGNNLRPIIIDGSNVAMSHGNKLGFSCRGLRLATDWFKKRGHKEITIFVPAWRKQAPRADTPIWDQEILMELFDEKILKYTPARNIRGKRVVCYDDRYVIKLAVENEGIVVSNDNYRDLEKESPEFQKVIEERLLMYTFVDDKFMPPDDPLGRYGPSLDNFLRKEPTMPEALPPPCPYAKTKSCTFGNKCKFYHPERGNNPHRSVAEKLAANAKAKQTIRQSLSRDASPSDYDAPKKAPLRKTQSLMPGGKMALSRTKSLITPNSPGRSKAMQPGKQKSTDSSAKKSGKSKSERSHSAQHPKVLSTSSTPCGLHVTLTMPTPTDGEKFKTNEDIISSYRRMEKAHSDETDNYSGSPDSGGSLHPPGNWSTSHEALRATHSDPYKVGYETLSGFGHLSLAKTLSDESRTQESGGSGKSSRDSTPPLPVGNEHRKLQRQFTLYGQDDPRWQQKQAQQAVRSPAQSREQSPVGRQSPVRAWHGQGPPRGSHQAVLAHSSSSPSFLHPDHAETRRSGSVERMMAPQRPDHLWSHAEVQGSMYAGHPGVNMGVMAGQAEAVAAFHSQQHMNPGHAAPVRGPVAPHLTPPYLGHMQAGDPDSLLPGASPYPVHGYPMEVQRPPLARSLAMDDVPNQPILPSHHSPGQNRISRPQDFGLLMSRQNSSSDPQLHMRNDSVIDALVEKSNNSNQSPVEANLLRKHSLPWDALGRPERPRFPYNHGYPAQNLPFTVYPGEMNYTRSPYSVPAPVLAQRSSLPLSTLPGMPQNLLPRTPHPHLARGDYNPQMPPPAQPPLYPPHSAHQSLQSGEPQVPMAALLAAPLPNRDHLYEPLCKLFASHKVQRVMNEHPYETDSQKLCQYIINLKDD